jgi:type VI protein secretion system component VasK
MIKKAHLTASVAWIILAIPSVIWWKSSVLWVIIISIYANVVGHLSGYTAARADEAAEQDEKGKKDKEKS